MAANPQEVIAAAQVQLKRLNPTAKFRGFPLEEIEAAEALLGASLPPVLREFMLRMGDLTGGLFTGSDIAAPSEFVEFQEEAHNLLVGSGSSFRLPAKAVVFMLHQGYTFQYVEAGGSQEPPVHQYIEGEPMPTTVAASFEHLIADELRLMQKNQS